MSKQPVTSEQVRAAFKRPNSKLRPCRVVEFALTLPAEDRELLDAALAIREVTAPEVQKWCAERGYKYGPQTISIHRRGDCHCGDAL